MAKIIQSILGGIMTGNIAGGDKAGQKEKLWALLWANKDSMTSFEMVKICHQLSDEKLKTIELPTIRRCMQELLRVGMVKKYPSIEKDARGRTIPLWKAMARKLD